MKIPVIFLLVIIITYTVYICRNINLNVAAPSKPVIPSDIHKYNIQNIVKILKFFFESLRL